jgi:hypothetical protein
MAYSRKFAVGLSARFRSGAKTSQNGLVIVDMGTVLFCLRLLLDVDVRLREHIGRRGELVTLIVLILNTIDLQSVPVLEFSSDLEDLAATTVKLPASLHANLKRVANLRRSSMNALMNSAIWAYTEDEVRKSDHNFKVSR